MLVIVTEELYPLKNSIPEQASKIIIGITWVAAIHEVVDLSRLTSFLIKASLPILVVTNTSPVVKYALSRTLVET